MTIIRKHESGAPIRDVCAICGNPVTLYTKSAAHLETEWGKFSLHFHKACENEKSRQVVTEKLKAIALERRPKNFK